MQYPIGCIITCLLCAHCSNICNICKEYSALSVKTSDNKMNNPIPVCLSFGGSSTVENLEEILDL